jgi:hypothetical protein
MDVADTIVQEQVEVYNLPETATVPSSGFG